MRRSRPNDVLYYCQNGIEVIRRASEAYVPEVDVFDQQAKLDEEVAELAVEIANQDQYQAAEECADVVIAAARLGTLLSPDFAKVIADKCEALHERARGRS